jgi:hypothetical protein
MTHDELLAQLEYMENVECVDERAMKALQEIVDLHSPLSRSDMIYEEDFSPHAMTRYAICSECSIDNEIELEYPCPTIQAIGRALV